MRSRKTRLAAIVDVLAHNNIGCQDELSKHLAMRGFIVTQATLSRDLKKLHTNKVANDMGGYRYMVSLPAEADEKDEERPAVARATVQSARHLAALSVRRSANILIIKTRNGYAGGLAYDLDQVNHPLLLGTIAGADTVFAVVKEDAPDAALIDMLRDFLPTEVVQDAEKNLRG